MTATTAPPGGAASDDGRTPSDSRPLASKVRRGAIWSVASTIALRFGTIASTAVVAHILDRQDFGVFTVALTALMIVTSFGELGVASSLIRADLDIDLLGPTMVTVSLISGLVLAGVMLEYARPIAIAIGGHRSASAAGPIKVMAISAVLAGVFAVPNAQLSRDFMQNKLFMSNLVAFLPSTAVLLIMAETGSGAYAFAWSRIAGQVVAGVMQYAAVSRRYRPGLAREALQVLLKFGLPLGGANFLGYVLLNVDYAYVGHLMGPVALAIYVLGFNVASWPVTLLSSMIGSVSMPAISRVKKNATRLRNAISGGVRAVALVVMPICALSIAFSHQLVTCIYGNKWASASGVLSILALYGSISIICMLFSGIISGLGKSRALLVVQIIWLAALIPAMATGVRHNGIDGAAAAHVVVIAPIVLPCYVFVLKRITRIKLRALVRAVLPPVIAAAAAALIAVRAARSLTAPAEQLVAGLVIGGVLYGVMMAPQLIALLSEQQAAKLRLDRITRAYASAARAFGLKPDVSGRAAAARRDSIFMRPSQGLTYSAAVGGSAFSSKGIEPKIVEQTLELRAVELRTLLDSGRPGSPHQARHARGDDHRVKRR